MELKITIKFSVNFLKMFFKYACFLKELSTSRSLYDNKNVAIFRKILLSKPVHTRFSIIKFCKTHRKLYMPASYFCKVEGCKLKIKLRCRCIPVNFKKCFRMTI